MPPVPKPPRSTPASRKAERQARERSPYKTYTERKVGEHSVKTLNQRTGLRMGGGLKVVGRRGKRLAPGDRKAAESIKGLQCICGCSQPVAWGHLQTRAIESTRHEEWASVPVCATIHPGWLDHGKGVKCREELFNLAKTLERRLTHEDAYEILKDHGYYTMLADRRVAER